VPHLSLAIRNAQIIDGHGGDRFIGDVGIIGDRIAAIGRVDGRAAHEVDAKLKVLAPGFVDAHTHYDPQLCWDGLATPSPEHGVTTLVAGNCGLSLAPVRPEGRDKIVRLFGVVEDISASTFAAGVPFNWESFPDYLAGLRGSLGPNAGMLVGHACLRLYVMGEAAQNRPASDSEIDQMCALLLAALQAGALGISFSYAHVDELGQKLPCFYSDSKERRALVQTLKTAGRGVVQLTPNLASRADLLDMFDECGHLSLETGVPISVAPITHMPGQGDLWLRMLLRLAAWRARGARLFCQVQTRPFDVSFQLSKGSLALSKGPLWSKLLNGPLVERLAAFRDQGVRATLQSELESLGRFVNFVTVRDCAAPESKQYIGEKIVTIAERERRRLVDVLLDIALADDLHCEFEIANFIHADPEIVGALLSHPGICIGAGDAGAHVAQFAGAGDTTFFLERFVRQLGLFSLEHAVRRLTRDIAEFWGFAARGVIREGAFADLVIFDPDTIARGPEIRVADLPGGGERLVRHPTGIANVFVNGEMLVENGRYSQARPGRVI
jgi:N-acyl-D-amino-acid deacylase